MTVKFFTFINSTMCAKSLDFKATLRSCFLISYCINTWRIKYHFLTLRSILCKFIHYQVQTHKNFKFSIIFQVVFSSLNPNSFLPVPTAPIFSSLLLHNTKDKTIVLVLHISIFLNEIYVLMPKICSICKKSVLHLS